MALPMCLSPYYLLHPTDEFSLIKLVMDIMEQVANTRLQILINTN
jgi:hypothetical protein